MRVLISEDDVQDACIVLAPRFGARLYRNNSGALKDARGIPVRFGLGNISSRFNAVWKSPDLIGWTRRGRFIGCECKEPGWTILGHKLTAHEVAQANCLLEIALAGGLALFCSDPMELERALRADGW